MHLISLFLNCWLTEFKLFQVATQNVGAKDIRELTIEAFNSITVQDWKNSCEHVKKIEREYYERGRTLYDDKDQLVIQVAADSSSSEDEYEDGNDESMLDDTNAAGAHFKESQLEEYLDFDLLDQTCTLIKITYE